MIERIVLHVQETDVTAPSFCVDQNPVHYQSPLKLHPTCACNHHCLHSCRWMNVAASAANLHPWPVLDPEEDVIRAAVQYHIHLSRAPRWTVEAKNISLLSLDWAPLTCPGFSPVRKCWFWLFLSHTNHLLQSTVSNGRQLQFSLFYSSGHLKPYSPLRRYSFREVSEPPISPFSPNTSLPLTRSFSAPHSVSILLAWFVWFPHAPLQKMLCLCNRFLRHLLCLSFPPLPAPPPPPFPSFPVLLLHNFSHQRLSFPISSDSVSSDVFLTIHSFSSSIKTLEKIYSRKRALAFAASLFEQDTSSATRKKNHWMNGVRTGWK